MARRETYSDSFTGEADKRIRLILGEGGDTEKRRSLRRSLLNVIKNELTPRQKEIIVLYYFKDMDIPNISSRLGVTSQAVSKVMCRARLRIFHVLQYYF